MTTSESTRADGLIRLAGEGERAVPVVAATGEPVAGLVHAAHEMAIAEAEAHFSGRGLDKDGLDAVLVYCAERACAEDGASCAGCRRRAEDEGLQSLDDFIASRGEIEVGRAEIRISGAGAEAARFDSVAEMAQRWAGEEYWFWARRVLRKLRHGVRRAHIQGSAVAGRGETPAVILMEPQLADNIGMVARAMANFGLDELRLVSPRDGWPNEKARVAASGANYVIDDATCHDGLVAAMADLNWMCATTARQRDLRKPVLTPEQAIAEISRRILAGQRCGILFGRERNGLETSEVANADAIVMIPVNSRFASLNLAQAVLLFGYEWMRTRDSYSLGRVTTYEQPIEPGLNLGEDRPATKEELFGFFGHIEGELERLGFFNPPERRPTVVHNMRTLFTRLGPTAQEIRTLRGIVATLAHGKGKGRKA